MKTGRSLVLAAIVTLTVTVIVTVTVLVAGCGGASTEAATPAPVAAPPPPPTPSGAPKPTSVTVSLVGTADLHGRVSALPVLGGYLENLRRARSADGGVVLVDAGDMFQGTLESNLGEGAAVVTAYNLLGYAAATIGNHEFDFGPVGEVSVAREPGDDPRGALKARAREAHFPFLAANIYDAATKKPVDWDNVHPFVVVEVAGVKVGIIGVTSESTPRTTVSANFVGLVMAPLAKTIADDAAAARDQGATVIVVVAHAGGNCKRFDDPKDLSSCDKDAEIFQVARDLPAGTVDAIVAGHTHAGVAQEIAGIPIVQSYANGQAIGRIDLQVDADGRVTGHTIYPPRDLCRDKKRDAACDPGDYEGAPVQAEAAIAKGIEPAIERAREQRAEKLGITVTEKITRHYDKESALGNLAADLMRAAHPKVDAALTNGGGLRADLPVGPLTYGDVFEAFPFDNRFAFIKMTGADLATIVRANLQHDAGILSISGVRALARCAGDMLEVTLFRAGGRIVRRDEKLTIATSDFLATGGDGFFAGVKLDPSATVLDPGPPFREAIAGGLRAHGGTLSGSDPRIIDPKKPRLDYQGARPVTCR